MRKTIVPVAIVLAASAVPMQAQEYAVTYEGISRQISEVSSLLGTYPKAVQDEFMPKLSQWQTSLNETNADGEKTDEEKEKIYANISSEVTKVKDAAEAAEKTYAEARDAALKAIDAAKTAYSDASDAIIVLQVPSVRTTYTTLLSQFTEPAEPTAAELYESKVLSEKAIADWEAYQTEINGLKKQAVGDNTEEMKAQDVRLSALQALIDTYKLDAAGYYNTVSAYLSYPNQDSDKKYFKETAPDAFDSKGTEIKNSKKSWLLTEIEAESFEGELEDLKKKLDAAADTANKNAKAQAKANAKKLTETLPAKYNESEYVDKFISDAKKQADDAIQAALNKKAELSETLDAIEHSKMANELYQLVTDVAPFVTAVTKAENNYAAYTDLVKLHDVLKKTYDKVAIELSTMQANGEIDSKYYNEANNKLNVVAQNLANLSKQNKTNYDDQLYADYTASTPDDDYNIAKSLLGEYDEASKIEKILEDAKKANEAFNANLKKIEDLHNTVITADVTVTPTDTKYQSAADQLNPELTQKKSDVLGQINTFEQAYKESKDFDSKKFNAISQAVDGFNTAVTKAKADLKAYEDSKNKLAEWTIAVGAIEVPNEEVNAAYPEADKEILNGYIKDVNDIKADIKFLTEKTDEAFVGPDRTSQDVWSTISGRDYDTTLQTLNTELKKAYKKYKEWRDKQGDEAAYNLGMKYYAELSHLFSDAVKNGAYAVDDKGMQAVQDEMTQFDTQLKQHESSHATNNCIALMDSWAKTYETVKASITRHEETLAEYNKARLTLEAETIKSADVKKLYDNLKDQSAINDINDAITAAQNTLKEVYTAKVTATEGVKDLADEATYLQTGILKLIAQASLKETYSENVKAAINDVTTKLTDDLNPNLYYTKQLAKKQTAYEAIVSALTYESYNDAKKQEVEDLITSINNVLLSAQANYDKYQSQMTAHDNAKAKWANFYSSVGATYGDQFPGAQAIYQGQLNGILKNLNDYEATITAKYEEGASEALGDKDYSEIIRCMQDIAENAALNKTTYESQKQALSDLRTKDYEPAITVLNDKISTVEANINKAVGEENDVQRALLKEQLESLKAYKDSLEGEAETSIKKRIADLTARVKDAVNKCESSANNGLYTEEVATISQDIDGILAKANGNYNANVKEHNTVIKKLFMTAYNAAKAKYELYALEINKYAGYKHALANGKSAYEDCINTTHAAIFDINTALIATKDTATTQFAADTQNGIYTDSSQPFAKEVKGYEDALVAAYNKFLADTKEIAEAYAAPLRTLAVEYKEAYGTVSEYDIFKGDTPVAILTDYFTFDGTQPEKDYEKFGPEMLDDLLASVETQMGQVTTAWNDAAKAEAQYALKGLSDLYFEYRDFVYPEGYTAWTAALKDADQAIRAAKAAIETMDHTGLADIKSDISTAIDNLSNAKKTADEVYSDAITTRDNNQKTIDGISEKIKAYEAPHAYAEKLKDLRSKAEKAVSEANDANQAAYNALYKDTNLNSELANAIEAAKAALEDLNAEAKRLEEANPPADIVQTLKDKAQELVPLYNRAEANANTDTAKEACADLYSRLTKLLNDLDTTDANEIVKNKNQYEKDIETLRNDIIAADVEQKAYNDLLVSLEKVNAALQTVEDYIAASDFDSKLNDEFEATLSELKSQLSAALTQINIDHANNLCGKHNAGFNAEKLNGISENISTLYEDAKAKAEEGELKKAEMRAANEEKFNTASSAISELYNELDRQWFVAQEQYVNVFTLFARSVSTLEKDIKALQTSLDDAYAAAQNVGGDPSALDTSMYAPASLSTYYTEISTLMNKISKRQARFEADVTNLNGQIAELKEAFEAIKISDIVAADEKVQNDKAAIETAIAEIEAKMKNFGPNDTEIVQGKIDAANAQIKEFAKLVDSKIYGPGDITGTGAVDVNDTFMILQLILEKSTGDTLDENARNAADMDGDGEFTVADLVQINNLYVYGKKTGLQGSNKVAAADAEVGSIDMQIDTDRMSVLLDSNTGYSAIQMDVELPQGVSINEVNFAGDSQKVMVATNTLESGVQRIVLYTTDGSNILNGENSLINLNLAGEGMGIVGIDNIIASTAAGLRHNLMGVTGAYTIVTGIEAVETTEGNTSVFDINGMVRKTVQKGVNIVKDAAGKVKKMLMK